MSKSIYIIGISGGFRQGNYDASAVILKDGEVIAGVEEERLSRVKHDPGTLPKRAINFCLEKANISINEINYVAYHHSSYENIKNNIENYFLFHFGICPEVFCVDHHSAHAACSYYLSGFNEANIITIDFSGDNKCTTLSHAVDNNITRKIPNEFRYIYSIITQYLGFQILSDEYKVMGLAAYGNMIKSSKKHLIKFKCW